MSLAFRRLFAPVGFSGRLLARLGTAFLLTAAFAFAIPSPVCAQDLSSTSSPATVAPASKPATKTSSKSASVKTVAQTTSSTKSASTKPVAAKTAAAKPAPKPVDAGPTVKSYGSSSAPIKMEVFTDYQCPSCRNFFEGTLKELVVGNYVTSGKVYVVHHDFPLQVHMYSGVAALWANASAKIGEFPAAEAALYDNQDAWQASGDIAKYISSAMSSADFKRVEAMVKACPVPAPQSTWNKSDPLAQTPHPCALERGIADDIELGYKLPVQATPTYVITYKGQRLPTGSNSVSLPILQQFFDSLLSQ